MNISSSKIMQSSLSEEKWHKSVPYIVNECCTLIERNHITYIWLHRINGRSKYLDMIMEIAKDKGFKHVLDNNLYDINQPNILSGFLKKTISCIPGKLLDKKLYCMMEKQLSNNNILTNIGAMNVILYNIPTVRKEILFRIFKHFNLVSENCHINKMDIWNLCISFLPVFVNVSIHNNKLNVKEFNLKLKSVYFMAKYYDLMIKPPIPDNLDMTVLDRCIKWVREKVVSANMKFSFEDITIFTIESQSLKTIQICD